MTPMVGLLMGGSENGVRPLAWTWRQVGRREGKGSDPMPSKTLASARDRAQYRGCPTPHLAGGDSDDLAPARHLARLARHAGAARAPPSRRPPRGGAGRRAVAALVHDGA